jgi:glycosyltransferase involved in cell wall biosynthesis
MSTHTTHTTTLPPSTGEADGHAVSAPRATPPVPAVEIVLPVYNEERILDSSVRTLHERLRRQCAFTWQITIAENASSDATPALADELSRELDGVTVLHLSQKGRGLALRTAWAASRADVVAYMDIDLSTDLDSLPDLLEPLLAGRGDIAIGSRLAPGARVTRSLRREIISRSYNLLLRGLLGVTFADAQCGFKAARREAVRDLLADTEDDGWFFDTELLYLAQRNRLAIREIPVCWVEDRDSRVALIATALADLRGIARLRRRNPRSAPETPPAARTASGAPAADDSEATHDHTLRLGRTARRQPHSGVAPRAVRQSRLAH